MTARLIRRVAMLLLALYAFGQASVALAGCERDRGSMVEAMTMPASDDPCDDCTLATAPPVTATCLAHCTADLQAPATQPAAISSAGSQPLLPGAVSRLRSPPVPVASPAHHPPRRILLHSFQV